MGEPADRLLIETLNKIVCFNSRCDAVAREMSQPWFKLRQNQDGNART
jgi:hypothetical protein